MIEKIFRFIMLLWFAFLLAIVARMILYWIGLVLGFYWRGFVLGWNGGFL